MKPNKHTFFTKTTARLERKYIIIFSYRDFLPTWIFSHPSGFIEIYPKRQVNTLYFDTPTFTHHKASVDGDYFRCKPRLRWYNPKTIGFNAQLEFKIKKGYLGYKELFKMKINNKKLNNLNVSPKDILLKLKKADRTGIEKLESEILKGERIMFNMSSELLFSNRESFI